jgi:ubiquinone/menaquinone biosynthesis C-methylase UbiE
MPSTKENYQIFENVYHWKDCGEEWSLPWGNSTYQWYGSIMPRISRFVPTGTILEIAPGYGRWTHFLKDYCKKLIIVDLSGKCIDNCMARFSGNTHIEYHVNNGMSLEMIKDNSIDFVFSYDSLVHVNDGVLDAYLGHLQAKLKKNGAAFIHHSNLGNYPLYRKAQGRKKLYRILRKWSVLEESFGRDYRVSAPKIRKLITHNKLQCVSQEIIKWRTKRIYSDCFTIFTPKGPITHDLPIIRKNGNFMQEARLLKDIHDLYC